MRQVHAGGAQQLGARKMSCAAAPIHLPDGFKEVDTRRMSCCEYA